MGGRKRLSTKCGDRCRINGPVKPTLYHLSYSPYSERARWALDHHHVEHVRKHYTPTLGEARLRLALRRLDQRVTVPVLVTERGVFDDSMLIAQYAEEIGDGAALFPRSAMESIISWNDVSERSLGAARFLVLSKLLEHDGALDASLPRRVPRAVKLGLRPMTRAIAKRSLREYAEQTAGMSMAVNEAELCRGLDSMSQALETQPYLAGETFTYADITMSVVLQAVDPVDNKYMRLRAETRPCWENPALARQYQHLLTWRDELYRAHRKSKRPE